MEGVSIISPEGVFFFLVINEMMSRSPSCVFEKIKVE